MCAVGVAACGSADDPGSGADASGTPTAGHDGGADVGAATNDAAIGDDANDASPDGARDGDAGGATTSDAGDASSDADDASDTRDAAADDGAADADDGADASDAATCIAPLYAVSETTYDVAVLDAGAGGVADPTFGRGGRFDPAPSAFGYGPDESRRITTIARRDDGRLVASAMGASGGGAVNQELVMQVLADGSGLDTTFGTAGFVKLPATFHEDDDVSAQKMALDAAGRAAVVGACGYVDSQSPGAACVARVDANGALDEAFGTHGVAQIAALPPDSVGHAVAVDDAGRLVVVGTWWPTDAPEGSSLLVERLNADGTPDSTFGSGQGFVLYRHPTQATTGSEDGIAVRVQKSGRIVVLAQTYEPGPTAPDFLFVAFTPDGALDPTFAPGTCDTPGTRHVDFGEWDHPAAMELASDESIVAIGSCNTSAKENALVAVRLTRDGDVDTTFAGTGLARWVTADGSGVLTHAVALLGGATYVGLWHDRSLEGFWLGDPLVAKLDPSGALDPTYGVGGLGRLPYVDEADGMIVNALGGALYAGGGIVTGDGGTLGYTMTRVKP